MPEDLLKELKKRKVERGCKTWADLLADLMAEKGIVCITEKQRRKMKKGVEGFLKLQSEVSEKWKGPPSVLEEIRRSRHHETT